MSKYPWVRCWNQNCSWWAARHLAPLPSVCECMWDWENVTSVVKCFELSEDRKSAVEKSSGSITIKLSIVRQLDCPLHCCIQMINENARSYDLLTFNITWGSFRVNLKADWIYIKRSKCSYKAASSVIVLIKSLPYKQTQDNFFRFLVLRDQRSTK